MLIFLFGLSTKNCLKLILHARRGMSIPSDNHEFHVIGVISNPLVNINGKNSAGTVKDGGQGRNQSRHHDRQHQPPQSRRHDLDNKVRVGNVRTTGSTSAHTLTNVRVGTTHSICKDRKHPISHWANSCHMQN